MFAGILPDSVVRCCSEPKGRPGAGLCKLWLMGSAQHKLPFVPPLEGCRVERVHHVGPFVTRVELRLPDGQPWVWRSRRHRFLGGVRPLPAGAGKETGKAWWWLKIGLLARVVWWISVLFMAGSACFAVAGGAGLVPGVFGAFASDVTAVNTVFFVGSIFFTLAAYLQFLGAVNADRISAIAHRKVPQVRFRWFEWRPGEIGWLSAFTQFIGTILFNVNTFDALLPGLDWLQEDLLIWTPDAMGSLCFLAASALALIEYGDGRWGWRPRDVSWWVVSINMLGSVAFAVSAVFAIVLPGTAELLDARAVNAWTLLGAICFLTGAYLLLPEMHRNLRTLVAHVPSE